jgi:hypothetical protein
VGRAEREDLVQARPSETRVGRLSQVFIGVVVSLVAWPLIDVLLRRIEESQLIPGRTAPLSLLLVVVGIGLVAVVAWTFVGLVTAGAVSLALILFGQFVEEAPSMPGNLEFLLLRGAHEPGILILTGSWIALGVVGWLRSRTQRRILSGKSR